MSEVQSNGVQDGIDGAEEFEFAGTDGCGGVTMNERVTRLATALRQKLKVRDGWTPFCLFSFERCGFPVLSCH